MPPGWAAMARRDEGLARMSEVNDLSRASPLDLAPVSRERASRSTARARVLQRLVGVRVSTQSAPRINDGADAALDGRFEVESPLGAGTRIVARLPLGA